MRILLPLILGSVLLGSCGSPPKPPGVDESRKRPANTASGLALHSCNADLQNTRITVSQATRAADLANAAAARLALQLQAATVRPTSGDRDANAIYTISFAFGSAQVAIPPADADALREQAAGAALILLRGRTDGRVETPAESWMARARTLAVRDYLVHSGVDPARIRLTWQPIGDPVADNTTVPGRARNRRVEVELYRVKPHQLVVAGASSM